MTKKDYIILAKVIARNIDSQNKDHLHAFQFLPDLVVELRKDNPRFDGYRFIKECGQDQNNVYNR